uniref:Pyruvate carboxylase n=1 Tax=Chromera velia CCMP2878 TaxID=1169474 RepID=A0A0G4HCF9_9ALVE|eukprot:Cvel_26063.t1-p1 / transcript=Cvel_26063.t1 / gene=Cvel_26063 / organism=Chromera_velia_CCMP2878 / gene_product=Pyruvate carboxylase, mitochondrial, putative / transcript_product=Pyruvate carboxylase, mitochondrial, putative / location=Cvel_scaffold3040:4429-14827(-) / protein_length=1192 / sequence_SO=supercontig / SO=protein_coding / is_pseudo=false
MFRLRTSFLFRGRGLPLSAPQIFRHARLFSVLAPAPRETRPIKRLLIANRGEIAVRIQRACKELGIKSLSVYSKEDARSLHKANADEAYLVGQNLGPVAAYLDIPGIIKIAKQANADAIHPGYGFLSENASFAQAVEEAGIQFIGPHHTIVHKMGDKVEARKLAIEAGVSVIPGTETPVTTADEALRVAKEIGYPVMFKAAYGGGGRGMRRVLSEEEAKEAYERATSEALSAFGNGAMFVEKLVEKGRHIEVQIMGDNYGDIVHLYERDCTVQRRHQKVVEIAPAPFLTPETRQKILDDAVKLARHVGYQNAGTVEFLVDNEDNHYFIEVNARLQVEHTVTEEITGRDLVKTQIAVRQGSHLTDLGLTQESLASKCEGTSIQLRVTTEDSQENFMPSTGRIDLFQPPGGLGVRCDGAVGSSGAVVTPHYDSLLVKVITKGTSFEEATERAKRAMREMKVRGVTTNIPFILNVLNHEKFMSGDYTTRFIDDHPELKLYNQAEYHAGHLVKYLAEVAVNGPQTPIVNKDAHASRIPAVVPLTEEMETVDAPPRGWKQVLEESGPAGFAKAMREEKRTLLTDTTWRDAHQSLFATRLRTYDILQVAPSTAHLMPDLFSLENWGGATFDVAYRFLRECPWDRLEKMREAVPNIPFQMLLRGANAVGYTAYPDNAVHKFCDEAVKRGMDIFRVFDSLNYVENLKLGIDAVGSAGGVVEAAIAYSGNVADPERKPYTLDYYLELARELAALDIHILCIKDMAGLLTPNAATLLIGSLRREFPDLPIHVHTHDTGGTGVAVQVACAEAGADAVDVSVDSMSGLTSQPSMGAVVASLQGTDRATGIPLSTVSAISDYWEQCRKFYAPFDCTATLKAGSSDVYLHEIPGGQYTNLHMQAHSLGMADQWPAIKKAYAEANLLMGDIIKVTPSSKVVGDMAQFMVQNEVTKDNILEKADNLSFPKSVVEFFQGGIGQPPFGFPEPLRGKVLKGLPKIEGRPGKEMAAVEWQSVRATLESKYMRQFSDKELVSYIMYPQVFEEYLEFLKKYGDVSGLPSALYFLGPVEGEAPTRVFFPSDGTELEVKMVAKSPLFKDGTRDVFFECGGIPRSCNVKDQSAADERKQHPKATSGDVKQIGAPMPGQILSFKVRVGEKVKKGDPLVVISAMKMETMVVAPVDGEVEAIPLEPGEQIMGGDLLVKLK